jgi:hypothetical protein
VIKQTTIVFIFLVLFSCCKKKTEPCLTCPPQVEDTTSHVIQWQAPDTLGAMGMIRDVWVFSQNKAIAVGQIFLQDSTGQIDQSNPYIGCLWNGQKWELLKINYVNEGRTYRLTEIRGIWATKNNSYWFAAGSIFHWDGISNQTALVFSRLTLPDPNATIEKIWASSDLNVYGVGNSGAIVHYDGSSWTKMTSNTTINLQDIWGIDDTHIWTTGTNVSDGHCVVLQYNGTNWKIIYDNSLQPPKSYYGFSCIWTNNPLTIYLNGGSGTHILTLNNLNIGAEVKTGLSYVGSSIRGINQSDIFDVTTGGEVAHYNGSSWYCYPEIKAFNKSGAWFTRVYPTGNFVLIGGWYLTAYNGAPIVIRGYRKHKESVYL